MGKLGILQLAIIAFMVLLLSVSTMGHASADGGLRHEVKETDGYKVKLTFMDGNVQLGHNEMSVQITDLNGSDIGNIDVTLTASLFQETKSVSSSHMGSMKGDSVPSTEKPVKTSIVNLTPSDEAGEFEGVLDLPEPGHWMFTVAFTTTGMMRPVEFDIELSRGRDPAVLWTFLGVNTGIIGIAAVTRKRSSINQTSEDLI